MSDTVTFYPLSVVFLVAAGYVVYSLAMSTRRDRRNMDRFEAHIAHSEADSAKTIGLLTEIRDRLRK